MVWETTFKVTFKLPSEMNKYNDFIDHHDMSLWKVTFEKDLIILTKVINLEDIITEYKKELMYCLKDAFLDAECAFSLEDW